MQPQKTFYYINRHCPNDSDCNDSMVMVNSIARVSVRLQKYNWYLRVKGKNQAIRNLVKILKKRGYLKWEK